MVRDGGIHVERDGAASSTIACRVEGLTKTYRTGFAGRRRVAVSGISFAVRRGTVTGLLGHNGAGKTTTLKAILDLVRLDAGRVEIFGRDHRDRQARANVGYLPEAPYFYEHLTASELLDFYGRLGGLTPRERARRTSEVLDQVGMGGQARTPLRRYSKGMLQRVGLAQAILHDPDLLILDEPMSGLDPLGRRDVRDLLGELRGRGKTILLSSHIVPDLEALADEVLMLRHGRVAGLHCPREGTAPRFEVWLARLPSDTRAPTLWGEQLPQPAGKGQSGWTVILSDVPRLRVLLALCADEGIDVRGVQSRQTGLEEAFLAALAAPSPAMAHAASLPPEPQASPLHAGAPAVTARGTTTGKTAVRSGVDRERDGEASHEGAEEEPVLVGAGEEAPR